MATPDHGGTEQEALATLLLDMYGPWGGPPKMRRRVWARHLENAGRILSRRESEASGVDPDAVEAGALAIEEYDEAQPSGPFDTHEDNRGKARAVIERLRLSESEIRRDQAEKDAEITRGNWLAQGLAERILGQFDPKDCGARNPRTGWICDAHLGEKHRMLLPSGDVYDWLDD